jgi:hypothetical protein
VSVGAALIFSGIATVATTALGLVARLPDDVADVGPLNHWRMPALVQNAEPGPDDGPVLVTVEYHVAPTQAGAFLDSIERYGRVRRRDGASRRASSGMWNNRIAMSNRFW